MKYHSCSSLLLAFVAGFLVLGLFGCQQPEGPTLLPAEPSITLLETSSTQVQAFKEALTFKIEYTDGDGDLGTNDDTQRNVFVSDSRINGLQSFRLQQLAPDGAEISITGTFSLELPFTILTDSVESETVQFSIYVVDRAGNASNIESSEVITVVK